MATNGNKIVHTHCNSFTFWLKSSCYENRQNAVVFQNSVIFHDQILKICYFSHESEKTCYNVLAVLVVPSKLQLS